MSCKEIKEVIHGYLDGELDLVRSMAIEQHLKECPACVRAYQEQQSLRTAIAGGSLYFDAPRDLERRVRSAVRQASKAEGRAEGRHWLWNWSWPIVVVPLAAAALVMLIALPLVIRHSAEDRLAEEIVSAHVRSFMAEHKTDVASSDQHTVKPWFDGKLDFAPPVNDLADRGFPLVGGRLDYVQGRPVAALVYQRNKHFINLFIWPASSNSTIAETLAARQGYNLMHWNASGMTFWAVSDLNRADLRDFARLIR